MIFYMMSMNVIGLLYCNVACREFKASLSTLCPGAPYFNCYFL